VVKVNAIAHRKARVPVKATLPATQRAGDFWMEPETAAFGYLRERLF
jgi:hypothetical protein